MNISITSLIIHGCQCSDDIRHFWMNANVQNIRKICKNLDRFIRNIRKYLYNREIFPVDAILKLEMPLVCFNTLSLSADISTFNAVCLKFFYIQRIPWMRASSINWCFKQCDWISKSNVRQQNFDAAKTDGFCWISSKMGKCFPRKHIEPV